LPAFGGAAAHVEVFGRGDLGAAGEALLQAFA